MKWTFWERIREVESWERELEAFFKKKSWCKKSQEKKRSHEKKETL